MAFVCLKVLAFADRTEQKDAADLAHVLQYFRGGDPLEIAAAFKTRLASGEHGEAVNKSIGLLRDLFTTTGQIEGWMKSGPVAAAKFWYGDDDEATDERIRRQREVAARSKRS